jgi:hypothetical protein
LLRALPEPEKALTKSKASLMPQALDEHLEENKGQRNH